MSASRNCMLLFSYSLLFSPALCIVTDIINSELKNMNSTHVFSGRKVKTYSAMGWQCRDRLFI